MKKNKKKKWLLVLFIIFIILIASIVLLCLSKEETNTAIVVKHSMEEYPYSLDERDTDLFEEEYDYLVEILTSEEIDYELYAEQISKLFIIDLYTLNNKISKYDVGGIDYLEDSIKSNFSLKVEDTLYKYISTLDSELLPEVFEISITSISGDTIIYNEISYEGYYVTLNWDYVEDLNYDTTGEIIIILEDDLLKIVEYIGEN